MEKRAYLRVPFQLDLKCEETQTEIANVEAVQVMIVDRIRREVPRIRSVLSKLEPKHCLKLGDFLMCQEFCVVHSEVRVVVRMHVVWIVFRA